MKSKKWCKSISCRNSEGDFGFVSRDDFNKEACGEATGEKFSLRGLVQMLERENLSENAKKMANFRVKFHSVT